MNKLILVLLFFFVSILPVSGQRKNYNCAILDSLFSAIQLKKEQNDFLLPRFETGEIKIDDGLFRVISKDSVKIKSVLRSANSKKNLFLTDELFSLDTFNIIVDTFNFFDVSCKSRLNKYLVVNDYRIIKNIRASCNVIEVVKIFHNKNGAIIIALKNIKSNFCVIFSVRRSPNLCPSISINGKYLFDPEYGIILE